MINKDKEIYSDLCQLARTIAEQSTDNPEMAKGIFGRVIVDEATRLLGEIEKRQMRPPSVSFGSICPSCGKQWGYLRSVCDNCMNKTQQK